MFTKCGLCYFLGELLIECSFVSTQIRSILHLCDCPNKNPEISKHMIHVFGLVIRCCSHACIGSVCMPSISQLIMYRAIDMKSCNPANDFMGVCKMH